MVGELPTPDLFKKNTKLPLALSWGSSGIIEVASERVMLPGGRSNSLSRLPKNF